MKTDVGEQVPQRHRWTVALVNAPRQISLIRERLLSELSPVSDIEEHFEMAIPKSRGLHFEAFSFSSDRGKIERPERVYNSRRLHYDRNLSVVRDEASWEEYLLRLN